MQLVNTKLMLHPLNWAIVFMMLVIAAIAGHETLTLAHVEPSKSS